MHWSKQSKAVEVNQYNSIKVDHAWLTLVPTTFMTIFFSSKTLSMNQTVDISKRYSPLWISWWKLSYIQDDPLQKIFWSDL